MTTENRSERRKIRCSDFYPFSDRIGGKPRQEKNIKIQNCRGKPWVGKGDKEFCFFFGLTNIFFLISFWSKMFLPRPPSPLFLGCVGWWEKGNVYGSLSFERMKFLLYENQLRKRLWPEIRVAVTGRIQCGDEGRYLG